MRSVIRSASAWLKLVRSMWLLPGAAMTSIPPKPYSPAKAATCSSGSLANGAVKIPTYMVGVSLSGNCGLLHGVFDASEEEAVERIGVHSGRHAHVGNLPAPRRVKLHGSRFAVLFQHACAHRLHLEDAVVE